MGLPLLLVDAEFGVVSQEHAGRVDIGVRRIAYSCYVLFGDLTAHAGQSEFLIHQLQFLMNLGEEVFPITHKLIKLQFPRSRQYLLILNNLLFIA